MNTIYKSQKSNNSFIGNYWVVKCDPETGEARPDLEYQWECFFGKIKFTYSRVDLKDGWIHRSIHWNNVFNGGIAWNFHFAYRLKFSFIKIGFNSIKNLYKDD